MAWPVLPFGFLGPSGDNDPYVVQKSLRFDGTAYLNRTFSTPTTQNTFTFSCWLKLGALGTARTIFAASSTHTFGFTTTNALNVTLGSSVLTTTGLFRDPSAWYHIVWSSNGAGGQNQTVYVNGVSVGVGTGTTSVNTVFNTAASHLVGAATTTTVFFSGYMTEIHFVDGQALTPTSFAENAPVANRWRPKAYTGTYGNNGFYLNFLDNSGLTSTTLGKDQKTSGTNNWTPNSFSVTPGSGDDSSFDSPTNSGNSGNYCTWNPLINGDTCSNGNLDVVNDTARGTQALLAYDAYWEITSTGGTTTAGIVSSAGTTNTTTIAAGKTYGFSLTKAGALEYINLTDSGSWTSITTGITGTVFPYASTPVSTTASLNAGQRLFKAISPSGLSGLKLWLRADAGVTLSGASVTNWSDQSGNGNNASGSAGTYPTRQTTQLNGLPVVSFDGTSFLSIPNPLTGSSGCSLFVVVNPTNTIADSGAIIGNIGSSSTASHYPYQGGLIYDATATTSRKDSISQPSGFYNWHIYNINSTNNLWEYRFNETQHYVTTTNTYSSSTAHNSGPHIGLYVDSSNSQYTFHGKIAEIIIYDRVLSDLEKSRIRAYLNEKYNIYRDKNVTNTETRTIQTTRLNMPVFKELSDPDKLMDTRAYAGDNTSKWLAASEFDVGLSWIKNRTTASTSNIIVDSLRNSEISLLLHMNGTNGSTTFTDSSANAFTITRSGAVISTAQSKFGGASGLFANSSNQYLSLPTSQAFNFGSGDWTIEFWYRKVGAPDEYGRIFQTADGDLYTGISISFDLDTDVLRLDCSGNGSSHLFNLFSTTTVSSTAFKHYAFVRSGTSFKVYEDGVERGSATSSASLFFNPADFIVIGGQSPNQRSANGYIDELRVTKGLALYTSAFTPPSVAFSDPPFALSTDTTAADATTTVKLGTGADSGKVFVTNASTLNATSSNYINWRWKTSDTVSSNTNGSITSRVMAEPIGKASVVRYVGTGANATVGHGLGATPAFVMVKQRNGTNAGAVYHQSLGATKHLKLFDISTAIDDNETVDNTVWNGSAPTFNSTVFSIGTSVKTNVSGGVYIAYCFSEVEGYSRFGTYLSNASTDGPFVWCGFRPKWILIKSSSLTGTQWYIWDDQRSPVNLTTLGLQAGLGAAEVSGADIDILSNGFKLRDTEASINTTANTTYVFAAFAQTPFKYARAR